MARNIKIKQLNISLLIKENLKDNEVLTMTTKLTN